VPKAVLPPELAFAAAATTGDPAGSWPNGSDLSGPYVWNELRGRSRSTKFADSSFGDAIPDANSCFV
jgi:hypothetical protein